MAIKIDFEKAYDQIRWDSLRETLELFGFSEKWIKITMSTAKGSRFLALQNGEKN